MKKLEVKIHDIIVYNDIYMAKGKWEQIPAHIIEDNDQLASGNHGYAWATDYRFEHDNLFDYFVLKLFMNMDFIFEKFYPLNIGFNEELIHMLEKARAFKTVGQTIDFDAVIDHYFDFEYEKCPDTGMYRIYNLEIDPQSYEDNIQNYIDYEIVFNDVLKEMKR